MTLYCTFLSPNFFTLLQRERERGRSANIMSKSSFLMMMGFFICRGFDEKRSKSKSIFLCNRLNLNIGRKLPLKNGNGNCMQKTYHMHKYCFLSPRTFYNMQKCSILLNFKVKIYYKSNSLLIKNIAGNSQPFIIITPSFFLSM